MLVLQVVHECLVDLIAIYVKTSRWLQGGIAIRSSGCHEEAKVEHIHNGIDSKGVLTSTKSFRPDLKPNTRPQELKYGFCLLVPLPWHQGVKDNGGVTFLRYGRGHLDEAVAMLATCHRMPM